MKLIVNELIPVYETDQSEKVVFGRELHQFLEVETRFNDWVERRTEKYGFIEGEDFSSIMSKTPTGGRPSTDYIFKLDVAKEIAMVENNEQGRKVRKYFIEIEKRFKQLAVAQPQLPQNYKEALIALVGQVEKNEILETEKLMLQQQVKEFESKASYLDRILQSKDTVAVTQIAQDYGLSGYALNQILHEEKIQYKLGGQWLLYQKHLDKGYTKSSTIDVLHNSGERTVKMNTKWTQKGRLFIHEILAKRGILPYMDRDQQDVANI